jgi:hypothetical protein
MKTSGLTFDPETHEYRLDGRRVPGVTETIGALAPHREVGEWYLQRGAAVHAAVALALKNELDPASVDERIAGRVAAVMNFLRDARLAFCVLETPLVSKRYRFAGTLDFLGEDEDGVRVLADWKGSLAPQVQVQMGAYSLLLQESPWKRCDKAVAVKTHDDGTYKCRWFTKAELRRAEQTFLAFLTVGNWLAANK